MKIKIVSCKDGSSGSRGRTFESRGPCSYDVIDESGGLCGRIECLKDPAYNLKTTAWRLNIFGYGAATYQYLADAKRVAIAHLS